METSLSHIKKGESLDNKQLVLINSNERDNPEQSTSSFTYTFDQPLKRISKMDLIYTKIPKSFYNVNNDNTTLSVTTETFTETRNDILIVDDSELQNNKILATNITDGTVIKSNKLTCNGDINMTKIITKDSFIYVSGIFCEDLIDFKNYYDETAGKPLSNTGKCDLFIAKYTIEQELELRFKISGLENEQTIDLFVVNDFLFISGNFNSFPLTFYNYKDAKVHTIVSNGNPTGFLAKYTLTGEFIWAVKTNGVNSNISPLLVTANDNTNKIYITGSFNEDLEFYNKENSNLSEDIITIPYTGNSDTHVFVAQYNYDGDLEWVSTIKSGSIAKSVCINTITDQVLVGVEFFDNLYFATEYVEQAVLHTPNGQSLELIGVQNLAIVEFKSDGTTDSRMRIGGSNFESNIRMDINGNFLAVAGLYNSNPLGFYDKDDETSGFVDVNGLVNNIFIAKYDLTSDKQFLWSVNIFAENNAVESLDISVTANGDILLVGNYSSLLKFNDIDSHIIGQDLLNDDGDIYTFIVKYSAAGKFENRSYIDTPAVGKTVGTCIDAHSNNAYIIGNFNTTSINLYNSNNTLHSSIDNSNSSNNLNNGFIISYINNVNNYNIDTTTLNRRIIYRTLNGTDLNYIINLNAFSQQLGLSSSTLLRAMIFGAPITWNYLDINETNNILVIEFNIGNKITKSFEKFIINFVITTFGSYSPYNLAFELNKVIKETLRKQTSFEFIEERDFIKYDAIKKLFYLIFSINGTFRIIANVGQPLYSLTGLNFPLTVSNHCAIAETNLEDESPIEIVDNSKLTLKIAKNNVERIFNNVDFSVAFPNVSSSSGVLRIDSQEEQQFALVSGNSDDDLSKDLQVKDNIQFDAPWLYSDANEVIFRETLQWESVASNFDNSIITAVVNNGYIYLSNTSGESWLQKEFIRAWKSIAMSQSGQYQTAVTFNGQIYVSNNFGAKWIPKESVRQWSDISISRNSDSLLDGKYQTAVNRGGRVYVSHDYGITWNAKGVKNRWVSVAVSGDGMKQAAVIFGGNVWYSSDYGLTWVESPNTTNDWSYISMSNDASVTAAVTKLDNVYYSSNAGIKWGPGVLVANGRTLNKISIAKNIPTIQTIIGDAGSIYHTIDGGTTWNSNNTHESWSGITLSDDGEKQTATVRRGGIYQTSDTGNNWKELRDSAPWLEVAMSSNGMYQIASRVSEYGGVIQEIWQSDDSGASWVEVNLDNLPVPREVYAQGGLAISADGVYRYYSYNNGIVRSSDYGVTWEEIVLNDYLVIGICLSVDGKHVTVGSGQGNIFVSNDFGLNFEQRKIGGLGTGVVSMTSDGSFQMSVGFLPGGEGGAVFTTTDYWINYTQHLPSITTWRTGSMSLDGSVLIAVGYGTSVYMSKDRGATWVANSNFTASEIITKFALSLDGSVIVALRQNKPIYLSKDKGVIFYKKETIRNYNSIAMSSTGKKITTVVRGGSIFQSNNFGDTWNIKRIIFSKSFKTKQWTTLSISRNGKFVVACAETGKMYLSKDYGKTFTEIEGENRKWVASAISDTGEKIVGAYTVGGVFNSGITTSWDGGKTFYTTNPNGLLSNIFITSIAMSSIGDVVLLGTISTDNNNIFISSNSLPPQPGEYDDSWMLNATTDIQNKRIACVAMNSTGTIRYAGVTESPGGLLRWVSSSSEFDPGPPYDVWYEVPLNNTEQLPAESLQVILVDCSDGGDEVTVGIRFQGLQYSSDGGNIFSVFRGPQVDGDNLTAELKMSSDGSIQVAILKRKLYVSYDNWESYNQKKSIRDCGSLAVSGDGQRIIAGELEGWLYQSFDKGENFGVQQTHRQPLGVAINFDGSKQVVSSNGRELYTSTTNGNKWLADGPAYTWADLAIAKNSNNAIAVPRFGFLYVSELIGSGWSPLQQLGEKRWTACAISYDGNYRLAANDSGILYISTGDINNPWLENSQLSGKKIKSCAINADGSLMAVAVFGEYIYVLNNNGMTWTQKADTRNWQCISSSYGTTLFAAELNGSLYYSVDSGGNWKEITNTIRNWQSVAVAIDSKGSYFTAVAFDDYIYTAVALDDYIYTADSNLIFQPKASIKQWVSVDISSNGKLQVAVSFNDEVYKSFDYGNTWSIQIGIKEITGISASNDGKYQAVVEQGGQIQISSDYGTTWSSKEFARAWRNVIVGQSSGNMIAVTYDGKIYSLSNHNDTWVVDLDINDDNFIPDSSDVTHNLVDISASSDLNVILAASFNGPLIRKNTEPWGVTNIGEEGWTSVSVSSYNGSIQYATKYNSRIWKSADYGDSWSELDASEALLWVDIECSGDGSYVTAVASGDKIYTSNDGGSTWTARDEKRIWNKVSVSSNGETQLAIVNDGQIYASMDYGETWIPKENTRQWRGVKIIGDSKQIAADINRLYFHNFSLDKRISFTVEKLESDLSLTDTAFTSEIATEEDLIINNFDLSLAQNFTIDRTTETPAIDIFIPPGNYTPETLVSTINEIISNINTDWPSPYGFTYSPINGKISFKSKTSGSGIVKSTNLLKQMGFNNLPDILTADVPIIATNSINHDFSGPLNIFIKSNIISIIRKNKTSFSKNKKISNIIAPLELDGLTNSYKVSFPVEIFLSKKSTISMVDIQIVDENGNIVNLNGSDIQVNFYFYSS